MIAACAKFTRVTGQFNHKTGGKYFSSNSCATAACITSRRQLNELSQLAKAVEDMLLQAPMTSELQRLLQVIDDPDALKLQRKEFC